MKYRCIAIILVFGFSIVCSAMSGELHDATAVGDIQRIKELLSKGHNINELGWPKTADDQFQATPLHWAVFMGKEEVAVFLIKNGANLNAITEGCCVYESPLDMAVIKNNIKMVVIILEAGANVEGIPGNAVEWPLLLSIINNHLEITKKLLKYGADLKRKGVDDYNVLHNAVNYNQIDSIKFLISKGMDVNETTGPLSDYITPLHIAANERNIELASILIANGAKINSIDKNGDTPLHRGIEKNNVNFVKLLIKNGAKTDIKNKSGKTPKSLAEEKANQTIIDLLK